MATSAKKVTLAESASPKGETANPITPKADKPDKVDKAKQDMISSAKSILERAKKLNQTAKEYARELHNVLCDALGHVKQHRNPTLLTNVFRTIHALTSQRSVQLWVQRYSNMKWTKIGDGPNTWKKPNGPDYEIDLEGAKAHPFWALPEVNAQQRPISYDIDGRIAGVIRLLDKAVLLDQVKATTKEEKERAVTHLAMLKEFAEKKLAIPPDKLAYQGPEATEAHALGEPEDAKAREGEAREAA